MKRTATICLLVLLALCLSGCSFLEELVCVSKELRYIPEPSPSPPLPLKWSEIDVRRQ